MLFIASAAVLCSLFVIARNTYYYDRFRTESALSKLRGISNNKLHAYVDVTEEINSSSFTVDGQTGSVVKLGGPQKRVLGKSRFLMEPLSSITSKSRASKLSQSISYALG